MNMGGSNCWVPGCGLSRDTKNVYFWKLPCTPHPDDIKWRKSMEDMIRRYRVVDKLLSDRLASGKVFTCERHFKDEDFEYTATGRKKVKLHYAVVKSTRKVPREAGKIPTSCAASA